MHVCLRKQARCMCEDVFPSRCVCGVWGSVMLHWLRSPLRAACPLCSVPYGGPCAWQIRCSGAVCPLPPHREVKYFSTLLEGPATDRQPGAHLGSKRLHGWLDRCKDPVLNRCHSLHNNFFSKQRWPLAFSFYLAHSTLKTTWNHNASRSW